MKSCDQTNSSPSLCRDVRLLILEHSRWSVIEKYRVVANGLTMDQLHAFVGALKAQLYAEGLVQGNFTSTVRHTHLHTQMRHGFRKQLLSDSLFGSTGVQRVPAVFQVSTTLKQEEFRHTSFGLVSCVIISVCVAAGTCSSGHRQQGCPFHSGWLSCLRNIISVR